MSDSRDPSDIPFPDDELPPENPAETHAREPGSDDDTPLPDEVSFYRLPPESEEDLREDTREDIPPGFGHADLTDDRPISQRAAARAPQHRGSADGGINAEWLEGLNAEQREAVAYLHKYYPDLIVDGEVQADFALNPDMLKDKFPFSKLAGKKVNTLIFPNLESANITYKLLKELYEVDSVGPIMMGMDKPAHIFQLGARVEEMVNMVAVAVVDAQEKEKRRKRWQHG